VSKTLRQWRTSQLKSIRELASDAGITAKTLTDIEYGRRHPTYGTMKMISNALNVSPHDIEEFARTIEARGRYEGGTQGRDPTQRRLEFLIGADLRR